MKFSISQIVWEEQFSSFSSTLLKQSVYIILKSLNYKWTVVPSVQVNAQKYMRIFAAN